MRINKSICISVRNITFAFIKFLKMMRKLKERDVLVGKEEFIVAIRMRFRKKEGKMKRKDKE